ncbi:BamA/TamA family outer membrane protein [Carboxylicivirga linearis]|uniref:BamA/TamA family outer membrane protein n=1 Tax=Carboxylicivirga linearis TaxID=1628157 RepID=A0ABS5JYZ5_9BACT|nr:BamA/TamA family outer membrane protein [Carboxylicivirga linearis]
MVFIWGCSTTKYVPEGSYLLNKVEIENSAKDVSKEELKGYLRQKGNIKILGFWRFHLGLYNLSGQDGSKGFNQWLRRIGEEPVLYDEVLKMKSNEQLSLYLRNKGYFNAHVRDTVIQTSSKKVKVKYSIEPGNRYNLNNVSYRIDDPNIEELVYEDSVKTLLKRGKPFDARMHDKERERITKKVRNNGYFDFRKDYIYFWADSALNNYSVNDSLIIANNLISLNKDKDTLINHRKSKIKDVYFVVGFDAQEALEHQETYFQQFDTLMYEGCHILYNKDLHFRADVLINSNYIFPGQFYKEELVNKTQNLLSDIQLFRFINIRFKVADQMLDEEGNQQLDCYIQLSASKTQSYTFEIEGTNSSGNLGAAGSFKYKHKNIARGGEVFEFGIRTATERQTQGVEKISFNTFEFGTETSVTIPKFLVPFKIESFRKRYNPRTGISAAYNYQRRPDYTRIIINGRLSYNWKSNPLVTHYLSPFELSLINVPYIDPEFYDRIEPTYLIYSYQDQLISSTSYSYIYNEQLSPGEKNYWYFQSNIEVAGNILNGFTNLFNLGGSGDYKELLGIRYAQYLKSDIDIRYHFNVNRINSFAYRFFAGVAYPYGNSQTMPFVKQYFSGGANSVRAWPVRGLGPGSHKESVINYYNMTADIKLEFNAEYRYKLFWLLEGALFLDVGNIWDITSTGDEVRDANGLFKFNQFYKQLAVGVGTGLRLDFNYFVFRLDMGLKARDPSLQKGDRWILGRRALTWDDTAFNFAIGYPF